MKIHVFDDFIEQHHCNRMLWSFFNALPPFDVTMEEGQDYFKAKKRIYADYIKYCPDSPAHLMFKWVRKKIKRKVHELYGPDHFHHLTLISETAPGVQCKPKAGTLLIFDSSWKHEHGVRPVKNNSRFNISSWYASEELNERFKDTEHFDQREQT